MKHNFRGHRSTLLFGHVHFFGSPIRNTPLKSIHYVKKIVVFFAWKWIGEQKCSLIISSLFGSLILISSKDSKKLLPKNVNPAKSEKPAYIWLESAQPVNVPGPRPLPRLTDIYILTKLSNFFVLCFCFVSFCSWRFGPNKKLGFATCSKYWREILKFTVRF